LQYTAGGFRQTVLTPEEIRRRLTEGTTWVAERTGSIVGTVSVVRGAHALRIRSMAVRPEARGQGVATLLLAAVQAYAAEAGMRRLELSTTPFLQAAIRLYEAAGFRSSSQGPGDLSGTPLIGMSKELPADPYWLPPNLPVPTDDGLADHLLGARLPSIALPASDGTTVDLSRVPGRAVVFAFPRTSRPGEAPLVPDWDLIPGARGCTPQACGFRDLASAFERHRCHLFGLSTQETADQRELAARLQLRFQLLSDTGLRLATALGLPTFTVAGQVLLKRLTWSQLDGTVERVFYPVFPPGKNAQEVLSWISAERGDP
jgi:peroxiredoxin/predicted GNAT family acetyltransferase